MFRNFAIAVTSVAVLAVAANLQAQGQGGPGRGRGMMGAPGGGMLMLLQNEQVQTDIKLTADQKEKVVALDKEAQDARQARRDEMQNLSQEERQAKMKEAGDKTQKKVEAILLPNQFERLKQIQLQVQLQMMPGMALSSPEVVKGLGLTDDQQAKIKSINDDARKAMGEIFSGGMQNRTPEDREKLKKSRLETKTKLMDVLTAEQKEKLEKMEGPKFDISVLRGMPTRTR